MEYDGCIDRYGCTEKVAGEEVRIPRRKKAGWMQLMRDYGCGWLRACREGDVTRTQIGSGGVRKQLDCVIMHHESKCGVTYVSGRRQRSWDHYPLILEVNGVQQKKWGLSTTSGARGFPIGKDEIRSFREAALPTGDEAAWKASTGAGGLERVLERIEDAVGKTKATTSSTRRKRRTGT